MSAAEDFTLQRGAYRVRAVLQEQRVRLELERDKGASEGWTKIDQRWFSLGALEAHSPLVSKARIVLEVLRYLRSAQKP